MSARPSIRVVQLLHPSHKPRVLDNAQTAVFTSAKSTQYVQILLLGRKQTSRILRGIYVRFSSGGRTAFVRKTVDRHTLHIPQGVQAEQHRPMITSSQQPVSHARLNSQVQSASGRSGFGCQHDNYTHVPIRTVPSVLMSLVINTPRSSALQPLCSRTACCAANSD